MSPIRITIDDATSGWVSFTRDGGRSTRASRSHLQKRLKAAEERDVVGVNGVDLDWQAIKDLLARMDEAHEVRMEELRDRAAEVRGW